MYSPFAVYRSEAARSLDLGQLVLGCRRADSKCARTSTVLRLLRALLLLIVFSQAQFDVSCACPAITRVGSDGILG